jgi:hypothetical protein
MGDGSPLELRPYCRSTGIGTHFGGKAVAILVFNIQYSVAKNIVQLAMPPCHWGLQ